MNASRPLQQQPQNAGLGPNSFSANASSTNLAVPLGRPLPKTPGSASGYPLPPSTAGSGSIHDHLNQQQQQQQQQQQHQHQQPPQQQVGAVGRGTPPVLTKRHSNVNIHIAQPNTTATLGSNGSYPSMYNQRQNKSWVHPKAASSVSISTSATNLLAGQSATSAAGTTAGLTTSSTFGAGRRLSMQDELMSPSYQQALTRPISPSVILNYKFPPAASASAGTPAGHASSVSSNLSNIPPSSTVTASLSSPTPTMPGAQVQQSSQQLQSHPSGAASNTFGAGEYGGNMKRNLGYHAGTAQGSVSSSALLNNRHQPTAPGQQLSGTASPTPLRHNAFEPTGSTSTVSTVSARHLQQNRRGPLLPANDDLSSPGEPDVDTAASTAGYQNSLSSASIQVAKEGWLWRRGNLLTWKRCYAIGRYRGDGQPGMLTLFKDNEHMFPIKTFDLADCYEVQVKSADAKGTARFEFKLVTRKEETWFGTDTMMERTCWIDALNNLMTAKGANVGASLSKLEAKLNTIRHRNNSHEYTPTTSSSSTELHPHKRQINSGPPFGTGSTMPITAAPTIPPTSMPHAGIIEEQLQIMQQELQTREQVLSKREHEIEQKRIESLLVQLKAWRGACRVTVTQQYAVRDQLLEKFMKAPRTAQDLVDRAKLHLDAGADQMAQIVSGHWDCLTVYDAGGGRHESSSGSKAMTGTILGLHRQLFRELRQVLLDLTINLDTRCSEIQRALLVVESHLSSFSYRDKRNRRRSGSFSSTPSETMTPEQTNNGPPLSTSASAAAEESIKSIRKKYSETHEALKVLSQKIKAGLNRLQQMPHEVDESAMTSFREEMRDHLKGLRLPTFALVSCIPDQPLLFHPVTGNADDTHVKVLVQDTVVNSSVGAFEEQPDKARTQVQSVNQANTPNVTTERPASALSNKEAAGTPAPSSRPQSFSPLGPRQSPFDRKESTPSRPISMVVSPDTPTDSSSLPLPKGLSAFLMSHSSSPTLAPAALPANPAAPPPLDTVEMTQKMRDLVMPEFDHLSAKQQETLKSLTTVLGDLSNSLMAKLGEIKEASQAQRQEFDELKDEIIDVMQLSATDPSGAQRDMSVLSDIRSKLADISNQLTIAQKGSVLPFSNSGSFVLGGNGGGPVGGLQRSMSTVVQHPSGHFSQYQTVDGSFRGRFPNSGSMVTGIGGGGGSGLDSVYGRASAFGNVLGPRARAGMLNRMSDLDGTDVQRSSSPEVVSKLDQLLLLLEFVNTAQCRLMAYQELAYERQTQTGNIDDGRMIAVQEHMAAMDRKMNLQLSLLGRLLELQDPAEKQPAKEEEQGTTRLTEIQDDDQAVESESVVVGKAKEHALPLAQLPGTFSAADSLTLAQVLERLEIDLLPSFRAQEERVQELSNHMIDLQRQLQQQQPQHQAPQRTPSNAGRHRILTSDNSPSGRAGTTPQSPMEPDSPALWRAALRPSQSNGSTIAKEKRAALSHFASSPSLPGSSSSTALPGVAGSPPVMSPSLSYKTSDRILEVLERLEARLDKASPEPFASTTPTAASTTTEQKEVVAVGGGGEQEQKNLVGQIQEAVNNIRADNDEVVRHLKSLVAAQMDQSKESQESQTTLLKQIMTMLTAIQGHGNDSSHAQPQWLKELKDELEAIACRLQSKDSSSSSHEPSRSFSPSSSSTTTTTTSPPMVLLDASEAGLYWKEPVQKIQDILVAESDRTEASWNEHRDEVALKVDTIISRLDDAEVSRDGELSEGLAEMREWIVRHSAMQTENLRSTVELMAMELKAAMNEVTRLDSDGDDENETSRAVKQSRSPSKGPSRQSSIKSTRPEEPAQHLQQEEADKFQELKDQLEMSSRVQMATFSEMADNLAGVEKMIRDMSQIMGVRRGGTVIRKREQEASRAMLAMEVKETIQEMMSSSGSSASLVDTTTPTASHGSGGQGALGNSSTSSSGGSSGFGGLFGGASSSSLNTGLLSGFGRRVGGGSQQAPPSLDSRRTSVERVSRDSIGSLDRDRDQQAALIQRQQQHQWLETRVEELQARKGRVELQVEQLEQDKMQLQAEKSQLAREVELLRREKQSLLLSADHQGGDPTAKRTSFRSSDPLEGLLVDRVSMLLQETARLEALKRKLEEEVREHPGSGTTSSLSSHNGGESDPSVLQVVPVGESGVMVGAAEDEESEDIVLVDKQRSQQWSPQTPSPRPSGE